MSFIGSDVTTALANLTIRVATLEQKLTNPTTAVNQSGPLVNRPGPGSLSPGTLYTSTDTGQVDQVQNSAWVTIVPAYSVAGHGAKVSKTGNTSIANNTLTPIPFDSTAFQDDAGMHSNSSNNTRITCVTPGRYYLYADIVFDVNATGDRIVLIRANGAAFLASARIGANATAGASTQVIVSTAISLIAGDYVEALAQQTSGGALNVLNFDGFGSTFFGMERLHG